MSPSTTDERPTAERPYTHEMIVVHRVFRRESAYLPRLVRAVPDGDTARAAKVADHLREYVAGLHSHHSVEDELIWPHLRTRAADERLIARVEEQHQRIDVSLTVVAEWTAAWERTADGIAGEELALALEQHRTVLLEHLDAEEQLVLPLVAEHLTVAEWDLVGRRGLERIPKSRLLIALGAILEDATPEERTYFLARTPLVGRLLWPPPVLRRLPGDTRAAGRGAGPVTLLNSAPLDVLDACRTCEFVTLGRDGTPLAWPTAVRRQKDGTLLLSTSLAFTQKALNIRRDDRVALLFSDPTGSGLPAHAPQIFVGGRVECPDEIMTGPEGVEDYWRMLFERQPHSRAYVTAPLRRLMDWYYLRLLITVTPDQLVLRPPLPTSAPQDPKGPHPLPGAAQLARFSSAVLAARDASGAPVLARTRPVPADEGFALDIPSDCAATPGPASLLVHRHDELLNHMHNTLVRGTLETAGDRGLLVPTKVVEPMGTGRPTDAIRVLRSTRRATARYLERRGLDRPRVRWDEFKALAVSAKRT
ncbi:hemerythrin domain-containing protein [Streptomyces sp. NPDC101455]|uniref:hemerythrin domain-containing protein n=1 Tax=Streptomyces sp. NPDC101455 TaxID=3366142 RepID=UPI00381D7C49